MIHEPLYTLPRPGSGSRIAPMVSSIYMNMFIKNRFVKLASKRELKIVQGISPASFPRSGDVVMLAKKYNIRLSIPFPANAIDNQVLRYRSRRHESPIAVYFD